MGGQDGGGVGGGGCAAGCAGPRAFGSHGGYFADGVIFPSGSQAELDDATSDFYDTWKDRYLEPACISGEYRVKTSPSTSAYTVSEGHAYGMIITAIMAGYEPEAQAYFDGLYAYYDGHRSTGDSGLMAWAQDESCANVGGSNSATDGDLDIAYALLLADRQWGSDGAIDYHAAAKAIIGSILASDVHPENSVLVGDWAGSGDSHYTGTRLSDQMPSHFKAFRRGSGVARWDDVVDKSYAIIDYLQTSHAASTGLLPDFAVGADGSTPSPANSGWLETNDGTYSWNACRAPWRIGTDYLMSGDARSQAAVRRLNAFIREATGGDPAAVRAGYQLDGTPTADYAELAFVAPFMVSAMVEPETGSNQAWLDALWGYVTTHDDGGYYADSIKLISMLVASGNWWAP
jgi:endo-1,4-beta-D-glucanase Y